MFMFFITTKILMKIGDSYLERCFFCCACVCVCVREKNNISYSSFSLCVFILLYTVDGKLVIGLLIDKITTGDVDKGHIKTTKDPWFYCST